MSGNDDTSEVGQSAYDIDRHTIRRIRDMDAERADLGMSWEDYLCYLIEVDRESANDDGLGELAVVLARLGVHYSTDTDQSGGGA